MPGPEGLAPTLVIGLLYSLLLFQKMESEWGLTSSLAASLILA